MSINCEMHVWSDAEHLRQIYCGFSELHRLGFINLTQIIAVPEELRGIDRTDYRLFNTKIVVDGKIKIYYDTHDWHWIDSDILEDADFYFKRSYDPEYLATFPGGDRVFPLGLNYAVSSSKIDPFRVERYKLYSGGQKLNMIAKGLRLDRFYSGTGELEQENKLSAMPNFSLDPKILFMARMWNPTDIQDKSQKRLVEEINEMRATCIRELRKNFKSNFFGGVAHDDYSSKYFADCILPSEIASSKQNYIKLLNEFSIGIATTGLNRSNGWKLAEYVAFSRAIITEPLHYQVTGNFRDGENFLEFTNPDELLNAATKLFEDKNLRIRLMANNRRYYMNYLKPEALIFNSLETVFRSKAKVES